MRYDRPVRQLLIECCHEMPNPFTVPDVVAWFGGRYPDVAANTVRTQFNALVGSGQLPVARDARGSYRRTTPPTSQAPRSPEPLAVPVAGAATQVVLLGCVKTKASTPQAARSLYVSTLWQRRRSYADATGRPWLVLSAKWGVVDPDEVIAPYDLALRDASREYRSAWGEFVVQQLAARFTLRDLTVEVHAGDPYVDAIRGPLERRGATVIDPVDASSMGETLAWYSAHAGPTAEAAARVPTDAGGPTGVGAQVADALTALRDPTDALPAVALSSTGWPGLDHPGLYSWWVDAAGADDLAHGLDLPVRAGLLYAGQAGATRVGGRSSANTLRGRLVSMHLGGRRRFSTLRHSLGVVLDRAFEVEGDEETLTAWMEQRLAVVVWPSYEAHSLGTVEDAVLEALDPPFNLRGMSASPVRRRLTELRAASPTR